MTTPAAAHAPSSHSPSSQPAAQALGPGRLVARRSGPLAGIVAVPGDKSISHRAVMLGGIAVGETVIHGLLVGDDVLRTARAMQAMGAQVVPPSPEAGAGGVWRVTGRGVGALTEPEDVLDLGNAGTSTRLLMGLIATNPITVVMTGDASLRRRPMARVTEPLS